MGKKLVCPQYFIAALTIMESIYQHTDLIKETDLIISILKELRLGRRSLNHL